MEIRLRITAVATALVLLLAACGGSGEADSPDIAPDAASDASAADLPDPCALIDQADVNAIFGETVEPGDSRDTSGSGGSVSGKACDWGGISTLSARIHVSPSYVTPMGLCDYCDAVTGYGDEAWGGVTDLGSGGGIFVVVTDGLGIQVEAYGPDATLEQLEALADSLLTGLP